MLVMVVITTSDLTSPHLSIGGLHSCQAAFFKLPGRALAELQSGSSRRYAPLHER